jgi:hypothetical protein
MYLKRKSRAHSMYDSDLSIPNNTDKTLSIWIEPWAHSLEVPKGAICKLTADSEIQGEFELVETEEGPVVYGWSGSNLKIYINGVLAEDFDNLRLPGLPEGMSARSFVDMMFGYNPVDIKSKPKKWWQIFRYPPNT